MSKYVKKCQNMSKNVKICQKILKYNIKKEVKKPKEIKIKFFKFFINKLIIKYNKKDSYKIN